MQSTNTNNILLIDGLNSYIRAYSTSPVVNDNGLHVGGISGFLLTIGYAIKLINPTKVVIIFDGQGGSLRRRKVLSEYKANRTPNSPILRNHESVYFGEAPEESMKRQMYQIVALLTTLPVTIIVIDNIEADDTIGYIASNLKDPEDMCHIMSTDRDFLQLINEKVRVWNPTRKKMYDSQILLDEYGITSQNFVLYRAITGDKGDNIKGIPGIQAKTLLRLVPEFGTPEKLTLERIKELCELRLNDSKTLRPKYELVLSNLDLIASKLDVMQLDNVNISGSAKLKILELYRRPVSRFDRIRFLHIMRENYMLNSIKNLNVWLNQVFNRLDLLVN